MCYSTTFERRAVHGFWCFLALIGRHTSNNTFEDYRLLFSIPDFLIFRSINAIQLDNNNRKGMKLKDCPMILRKKINRKIISITKLSPYCMPYLRLIILG